SDSVKHRLASQYEEKVRPCIDLIDSLRALGVEQDLALPAIAVIGDQSSGKSSVLEALSGVALPRGSGIVTRCPLVLKLKRQLQESAWKGRISYGTREVQLQDPSQVEKEILKAQNTLAGNGVSISHELISVDITSPEVPDLTLIDLPGITRVPVGNQPQDIGLQIKALIKKYIQRQETINLVVVPCNVDIATTEALSMAQEVDPRGDRTIGVLTKPDLVDKGAEPTVMKVAQNLTYHLQKGYMMVRCRGQEEITNRLSLAEATRKETMFFQKHPHFRALLQEGNATVPCLAERLTNELILHINKSLPLLEEQIRESHQRATEELHQCGDDTPSNEADRMFFLIEKIKMFNQDIEKLTEGEEVVKEKETRLFNKIREEFENWVGGLFDPAVKNIIHEKVSIYEKQYRGKELLGFVNYKTFQTIVHQYLEQLVDPALALLQKAVAKKHFSGFSNLNQRAQVSTHNLKTRQAEIAENLIQLQFRMEQLVYCQDEIYSMVLNQVRKEAITHRSKNPKTLLQPQAETPPADRLHPFFQETSKRLANQIPFIIQYFILQENGSCLQKAMMQVLQERENYSWLLQEQSDIAAKRRFLKDKIYRLSQAQRTLYNFYG
uniref:Interferon-induced GTP-binding protein Mx2 n=1 Tax=Neovison vison TaxID=452646 RepID=A0A8C7ACT7_NEOVI